VNTVCSAKGLDRVTHTVLLLGSQPDGPSAGTVALTVSHTGCLACCCVRLVLPAQFQAVPGACRCAGLRQCSVTAAFAMRQERVRSCLCDDLPAGSYVVRLEQLTAPR
jgi:hypothetical protein